MRRAALGEFVLGALILIYALGFLLEYSASVLGLYPVLDAREQLVLAERFAHGTLPAEAFYRAPLYAALLGRLLALGVAVGDLPFAARMLNGSLHLVSTWLVFLIALRVWRARLAAALAAGLFGCYPVALYFAADALDSSLATCLMLAGVAALQRASESERAHPRLDVAPAVGLLALAGLARPQMFAIALAVAAALAVRARRAPRPGLDLAAALLPLICVLGVMGAANWHVARDFRLLPWQGAYNLWAANGPQANGRYFTQQTRLVMHGEGINPARAESERLYRELAPAAADDYATQSRFWWRRTLNYVLDQPLRWLNLVLLKAGYALNNFEQYDLTTYHVHKARSSWLTPNPLGWSIVLALAVAAYCGSSARRRLNSVLGCGAAYAVGLLLTYVSARFRLPLVPLLAIAAGGVVTLRDRRAKGIGLLAAALVFGLSRWPLPASETEKTVLQDHLLIARAAVELGFDAEALTAARAALAHTPGDEAARELLCVAQFNRWLRGPQRLEDLPLAPCQDAAAFSSGARRVLGIAWWRLGRERDAIAIWQDLVANYPEEREQALAALIMTNYVSAWYVTLDWRSADRWDDALVLALAIKGHPRALPLVARRFSAAEAEQQAVVLERMFDNGVQGMPPVGKGDRAVRP